MSGGGGEVSPVESGSAAFQRGLRSGDLITAVNRQQIENLQQLQKIAKQSNILFLLIQRDNRMLMIQIR